MELGREDSLSAWIERVWKRTMEAYSEIYSWSVCIMVLVSRIRTNPGCSLTFLHRTLVQIKSHAQKVLKRMEAGENVFRRLDENAGHAQLLITKLNNLHKTKNKLSSPPQHQEQRRTEHILAASALCQLGDNASNSVEQGTPTTAHSHTPTSNPPSALL